MNSSLFVGIFASAVIILFVGTGVAFRILLNKIYKKDKNSGEFEQLIALKSAERMKAYYTAVLLFVAILLKYFPDYISQKNLGNLIILAISCSEIADRFFRRKLQIHTSFLSEAQEFTN